MNSEKIWEQTEWLVQARNMLKNLNKFPKKSKLILVLRHSHRNEPKVLRDIHKLRLTSQGHAMAIKFGENLPKHRFIRLFHSKIWRCEETAEDIHKGFQKAGGKSELKGELSTLYDIGINYNSYLEQLKNHNMREILLRWAAGFYHPQEWPFFIEYCQKAANLIWSQLKDAPEMGLDIYVTHDWHLMTFRFGWFGLPPDDRWIDYLGGFAFTFNEDHILLLDYGKSVSIEIPHWWKNMK